MMISPVELIRKTGGVGGRCQEHQEPDALRWWTLIALQRIWGGITWMRWVQKGWLSPQQNNACTNRAAVRQLIL